MPVKERGRYGYNNSIITAAQDTALSQINTSFAAIESYVGPTRVSYALLLVIYIYINNHTHTPPHATLAIRITHTDTS